MKKGLFDRRIPTILALLILIIIVGISTYLVQSGIFYIGKASTDTQPKNFSITNLTDRSFTATFSTDAPTEAVLVMNNKSITTTALDDRDSKKGVSQKYLSHHITIQNLEPTTSYNFHLLVNGKEYRGINYMATTLKSSINQQQMQENFTGKVTLPNGDPAADVLVKTKTADSLTISSTTDSFGNYTVSTQNLRKDDGSIPQITLDTQIFLTLSQNLLTTKVDTIFENAKQLPTIILQENYSFIPSQFSTPDEESKLSFVSNDTNLQTVSITVPRENQEFVDLKPLFKGTSYPNSSVSLSIGDNINERVVARSDGLWTYQPKTNFIPGKYTITITSGEGLNRTVLSRNFTIFPLGSQVKDPTGQSIAQAASLTGTPTPTQRPSSTPTSTPKPTSTPTPLPSSQPTPTNTPSPTLTPISTPTPLPSNQPTPTNTPTPTITPTATSIPTATPTLLPTINYTPTPTKIIPPTGFFENTALITGAAIFLIIGGVLIMLVL